MKQVSKKDIELFLKALEQFRIAGINISDVIPASLSFNLKIKALRRFTGVTAASSQEHCEDYRIPLQVN
jgi:hypothetical protein